MCESACMCECVCLKCKKLLFSVRVLFLQTSQMCVFSVRTMNPQTSPDTKSILTWKNTAALRDSNNQQLKCHEPENKTTCM